MRRLRDKCKNERLEEELHFKLQERCVRVPVRVGSSIENVRPLGLGLWTLTRAWCGLGWIWGLRVLGPAPSHLSFTSN